MTFKTVLPAGTYWIGDPCYPFPNTGPNSNLWHKFLDKNSCFGYCELEEIQIWLAGTYHGDGRFYGGGYCFPVDSALLGIMPISTVHFLNRTDIQLEDLGAFIEFVHPVQIEITENGQFTFGHICIKTNGE